MKWRHCCSGTDVGGAQVKPVQQAITGAEPLPVTTTIGALSEFYRAFNQRDLSLMEANWVPGDEAAMDNPLGGIKRGWPDIRSVYQTIFSSAARVRVEFWDYTVTEFRESFVAIGRERGELSLGAETLPLAIRTTRVFRADGNRWRQFHHHGSIDDATLLARYQQMVRGSG